MSKRPMLCASTPPRRILVVTGNENFCCTIRRILCRCGYTVELARSGEDAINVLEHEPFDLVLSEVALPGMCGLTVLCSARQKGRRTPFVLLTECETERMRWIVSGLESVRCLRLPVDVDQLKQVLTECFERGA